MFGLFTVLPGLREHNIARVMFSFAKKPYIYIEKLNFDISSKNWVFEAGRPLTENVDFILISEYALMTLIYLIKSFIIIFTFYLHVTLH
jgi:hypothetical protein